MKKYIRASKDRISLIKKNRKKIEAETDTEIRIRNLNVEVEGESLNVWNAKDIIRAVNDGFRIGQAFKLLNDEVQLKIVQLKQIVSSRSSIDKAKGRIIGRDGRTRELIERYSKASVSVHGDNVSIIGRPGEVAVASKAVEMLMNGAPHGKVYGFLEQNQPKNEMV